MSSITHLFTQSQLWLFYQSYCGKAEPTATSDNAEEFEALAPHKSDAQRPPSRTSSLLNRLIDKTNRVSIRSEHRATSTVMSGENSPLSTRGDVPTQLTSYTTPTSTAHLPKVPQRSVSQPLPTDPYASVSISAIPPRLPPLQRHPSITSFESIRDFAVPSSMLEPVTGTRKISLPLPPIRRKPVPLRPPASPRFLGRHPSCSALPTRSSSLPPLLESHMYLMSPMYSCGQIQERPSFESFHSRPSRPLLRRTSLSSLHSTRCSSLTSNADDELCINGPDIPGYTKVVHDRQIKHVIDNSSTFTTPERQSPTFFDGPSEAPLSALSAKNALKLSVMRKHRRTDDTTGASRNSDGSLPLRGLREGSIDEAEERINKARGMGSPWFGGRTRPQIRLRDFSTGDGAGGDGAGIMRDESSSKKRKKVAFEGDRKRTEKEASKGGKRKTPKEGESAKNPLTWAGIVLTGVKVGLTYYYEQAVSWVGGKVVLWQLKAYMRKHGDE